MIEAIVRAALTQRLIVVVLAVLLLAFGLNAARKLSVDAFPDVTNVQVQIATEALVARPKKSNVLSPCPWRSPPPACPACSKCVP